MGRLYSVKGWVEPSCGERDATEAFMASLSAVTAEYDYGRLIDHWRTVQSSGCSDYILFAATSKYANVMVEEAIKHAAASNVSFDGYFECHDEEDVDNWIMRIKDSSATKTRLPTWRDKEREENSVSVEPRSSAEDIAAAKKLLSDEGVADLKHIYRFLKQNLINGIKLQITKHGRVIIAEPGRIEPRLRSSNFVLRLVEELLQSDDEMHDA